MSMAVADTVSAQGLRAQHREAQNVHGPGTDLMAGSLSVRGEHTTPKKLEGDVEGRKGVKAIASRLGCPICV